MDGHYVPNLTFGFDLLPALLRHTTLPLVAHLVLENPDALIPDFARCGADVIIVCEDTCPDLPATLAAIHGHGVGAGLSLNPDRSLAQVEPYPERIDLLLLLGVVDATWSANQVHLDPTTQLLFDRAAASARSQLEEVVFATA